MEFHFEFVAIIILFIILGTLQLTLNNILVQLKEIKNIILTMKVKDKM
ncbi:hypothetical protein EAL2_c15970 [Peptoclostridium acidaminophilum DSM 3953]|uniref:Uncharacterized protein n=1 Tax=Peptoclostridium acidaminophilum DSM 3953 TaxID=1286171 RepID=W8TL07_PEPAC|nr:hypothetical protein [Peptoclostridium acidaminophilum]AHM56892.1 hypothetical protein EAL2_c15970 [Peptoclostridium acidaminophilum DSM 3953]